MEPLMLTNQRAEINGRFKFSALSLNRFDRFQVVLRRTEEENRKTKLRES